MEGRQERLPGKEGVAPKAMVLCVTFPATRGHNRALPVPITQTEWVSVNT